ncbi:MAG: site-specific integrase [Treponema sp.]|nr:site-specific integrase [Treponema sp.]
MDVVYLFREFNIVRIPFYKNDNALFYLLSVCDDCVWNELQREFVFKNYVNAENIIKVISGFICVFIDSNSPVCPKIFGFMEQPWKIAANISSIYKNDIHRNKLTRNDCNSGLVLTKSGINNNPFIFPKKTSLPEKLSEYWLNKLDMELRSRKYSRSTHKAYVYYNRLICSTLQKTAEEIRPDDVTEFIALMEKDKNYTASAMNLALSAVKFFFRHVLKKDDINEHHRPHQDGRLPMILSKEEIANVLVMEKNPKHRLLLMLVYSSGLRVSEVVALKKEHIDLSRKVIYVRLGKGRKDRSTLLSDRAAQFFEEYCKFFSIQKWLFPGYPESHHLSIRSAQNIFDKAVRRAGIIKKITIHGLRHTFATHLLESGTDIRYIQTLLGHANLRTTERYTHVARRNIFNIKSPLDTI